jgi:acyl carrier protein
MNAEPVAMALAHRLAALYRLGDARPGLDDNVFGPDAVALADRRLDSLDLVELAVTLEEELGLRMHQDDLRRLSTLRGLGGLAVQRANPAAVARFVDRWGGSGA